MVYSCGCQLDVGGEHLLLERRPVLKVEITVRFCTLGLFACLLVGIVRVVKSLVVTSLVLVI